MPYGNDLPRKVYAHGLGPSIAATADMKIEPGLDKRGKMSLRRQNRPRNRKKKGNQ